MRQVFYLVTDDAKLCAKLIKEEGDVQCVVKEKIGWPYESLYRWGYFFDFDTSETDYIWFFNSNAQVRPLPTACVGALALVSREADGALPCFVGVVCQCVEEVAAEEVLAPHTVVLHDLFAGKTYDVASFEKRPLSYAFVPNRPHYRWAMARLTTTDAS